MNYLLMNQDNPILLFRSKRNAFEEVELQEIVWLSNLTPVGCADLETFLNRRKAPKQRKHMEALFDHYHCNDTEGFLRVTHALSLNDTFWVKEEGSTLTPQPLTVILAAPVCPQPPLSLGRTASMPSAGFERMGTSTSTRQAATPLKSNRCRNTLLHSWRRKSAQKLFPMTLPFIMTSSSANASCLPAKRWDW